MNMFLLFCNNIKMAMYEITKYVQLRIFSVV